MLCCLYTESPSVANTVALRAVFMYRNVYYLFKHISIMRLFSNIFKVQYLAKLNKYNYRNYSSSKMSRTALLLLANGAEEMEVVITADVLRRAGVLLHFAYILN